MKSFVVRIRSLTLLLSAVTAFQSLLRSNSRIRRQHHHHHHHHQQQQQQLLLRHALPNNRHDTSNDIINDIINDNDNANTNPLSTSWTLSLQDLVNHTDFILHTITAAANDTTTTTTRRGMFSSALVATSVLLAPRMAFAATNKDGTTNLPWEPSPVNKRSGVTVFDAEREGYNVGFVTYLSRFLLNFDADCQRWWYSRAADLPRRGTLEQVDAMRLVQFGAFSASVEVGLQEYRGPDGPKRLMVNLLRRYCPAPRRAGSRARSARIGSLARSVVGETVERN